MNAERAATPKGRDPLATAPSSKTPKNSLPRGSDTPRPGRIYLVAGTRAVRGGREGYSVIRRTLPAAHRAAGDLDARGRGPATIFSAEISEWTPVPRPDPEEWWS